MADNNLEYFLHLDNAELIRSSAIRRPELITWVYFDGRNLVGSEEDIDEPLSDIWERDGTTPINTKYEGSQYFTFDHTLGKMVVDTTLEGEQYGDDPQTVFDFVTHALADCVARGTSEYMVVFSSHAAGFAGFGGDENERQLSPQTNPNLLNAIESALAAVSGAPGRFDVIGFDACLMSALKALDEFGPSITKYYLASETNVPGHGWAYQELSQIGSALDLALDVYNNFLTQTQGFPEHQTPKTIAIIDTSKFEAFRVALEEVSAEITALLETQSDPGFFAVLQRARAQVISFGSYVDMDPTTASAIDIGDFFALMAELCQPWKEVSCEISFRAHVLPTVTCLWHAGWDLAQYQPLECMPCFLPR